MTRSGRPVPAPWGARWLRIDRARQVAQPVDGVAVVRAAFGHCGAAPMAAIDAGRFETPAAIYTRRDRLTPDDPQPPSVDLCDCDVRARVDLQRAHDIYNPQLHDATCRYRSEATS